MLPTPARPSRKRCPVRSTTQHPSPLTSMSDGPAAPSIQLIGADPYQRGWVCFVHVVALMEQESHEANARVNARTTGGEGAPAKILPGAGLLGGPGVVASCRALLASDPRPGATLAAALPPTKVGRLFLT